MECLVIIVLGMFFCLFLERTLTYLCICHRIYVSKFCSGGFRI